MIKDWTTTWNFNFYELQEDKTWPQGFLTLRLIYCEIYCGSPFPVKILISQITIFSSLKHTVATTENLHATFAKMCLGNEVVCTYILLVSVYLLLMCATGSVLKVIFSSLLPSAVPRLIELCRSPTERNNSDSVLVACLVSVECVCIRVCVCRLIHTSKWLHVLNANLSFTRLCCLLQLHP